MMHKKHHAHRKAKTADQFHHDEQVSEEFPRIPGQGAMGALFFCAHRHRDGPFPGALETTADSGRVAG